jgi:hypothetical protein
MSVFDEVSRHGWLMRAKQPLIYTRVARKGDKLVQSGQSSDQSSILEEATNALGLGGNTCPSISADSHAQRQLVLTVGTLASQQTIPAYSRLLEKQFPVVPTNLECLT